MKVKQNKQWHHPKFSLVLVKSPDHVSLRSSTVPPGILEVDTTVLLFMQKHNSALPSETMANMPWGVAAVLTIYQRKNWLQHPSVMINFLPGKVMTGFFLHLADICMWNHFCRKCLHWCLLWAEALLELMHQKLCLGLPLLLHPHILRADGKPNTSFLI